ncbi:hypothetical protein DYY66_1262 [Candidatus Nitrosotalea sp. FS]|uniref:CAP domain-containing protein n=1 Tax=Candidatus Nitrosotalea sp. FS TaxID=2341021 RepID=UPI00140CE238|nr:CAP domain-containing protein [Candidatus Nitrosotalea sp. FS]NHH97954.1 hypothetical protein [Candidatus Nitrosotalea sp. FS]
MSEKCKNHQYVTTQKGKQICTVCGHEKSPKLRRIGIGITVGFANVAILVAILYAVSYGTQGTMYVMSNDGMAPFLERMDVVLVEKTPFEDIKKGDVILFVVHSQGKHSISRVIDIKENPRILQTQADSNKTAVHFVTKEDYFGKEYSVIPKLGYILDYNSFLVIGIIIFIIPIIIMPLRNKRKDFLKSTQESRYDYISTDYSYKKKSSIKTTIIIIIITLVLFSEIFIQLGGLALFDKAKPSNLSYDSQKYTEQTRNSLYAYALQIINKDRSDHGLLPVQLSNNTSAQRHADDMLQNEYFSHWNTMGVKPYVTYTQAGGKGSMAENISYEYTYCETVLCAPNVFDPQEQIKSHEHSMMYDDALSNWGHRDNILDPNHTHVNIGIAYNQDRFYFVEHFENNLIDWQKIDLVDQHQLELTGTLPVGYSFDSIDIYSDPSPQSLNKLDLDEKSPYNAGHYDEGTISGEIVKALPLESYYQECSTGKIEVTFDDGQKNCVDYVTFDNKSKYSNGIDITVDLSKWGGQDSLHTIYVHLKDKNGKEVEATSLTLEYLK